MDNENDNHNVIDFPLPVSTPHEIVDRRLTDAELVLHIGDDTPLEAAAAHAADEFDAANAGVKRFSEVRLADAGARRPTEQRWRDLWAGLVDAKTGLGYTRERRHDPAVRPTLLERAHNRSYAIARYVLLAAAVAIIGFYLRGSAYSGELSQSVWWSTAFALPVILVSGALTKMADSMDDLAAQRRFADRLTWLGSAIFVIWVGATAMIFGLASEGSLAVSIDLGGDATAPDGLEGWLAALFPQNTAGTILLGSHVLSEVLIASALGVRAKLFHEQARAKTATPRQDGGCALWQFDAHDARDDVVAREIAHHEACLSAIERGRAAAVTHARARMGLLVAERVAAAAQMQHEIMRRHTQDPIAAE